MNSVALLAVAYATVIVLPLCYYAIKLREENEEHMLTISKLIKQNSELEIRVFDKTQELNTYKFMFKERENLNRESVMNDVNKTINKPYGKENGKDDEGIQVQ